MDTTEVSLPLTEAELNPVIDNGNKLVASLTIAVGVIGVFGNAAVLLVVWSSRAQKKHNHLMNIFLINQICIDLTACLIMAITFAVNFPPMRNIYNDLDCALLGGQGLMWGIFVVSTVGLEALTLDRYLKIVFPIVHRNWITKKVKIGVVVATWIAPLAWLPVWAIATSRVDGYGNCLAQSFWPSMAHLNAYTYTYLTLFFFVPVIMFVICYGHMIYVLQTRTKKTKGEKTVSKAQVNIIRTLVLVASAFVLLWTPVNYKYLITIATGYNPKKMAVWTQVADMMCYCNSLINPIIYACKLDAIRKVIISKLCCKHGQVSPDNTESSVIDAKTGSSD